MKEIWISYLCFILLFVPGQAALGNLSPSSAGYQVNDAHLHYLDFIQETDGIQALLRAMNETGVEQTMITGMPVIKKWDAVEPMRPLYYLADDAPTYWYQATDIIVARALEDLPAEQRHRFHPFICGFNPTDRNAVDHIKRMLEWYPGLWEGIGEIFTRHDYLTALTYGEKGRANHIALDPIYELAAEQDLPVTIHSDIGSTWLKDPIYLHEVEEAVKKHPRTRIIWAHAGMSRDMNISNITQEMDRMLGTYDNLWVDLSWVVYDLCLVSGGKLSPVWVDLVEKYPDRFMIGSDAIGHFQDYNQTIRRYYIFLDALSPSTAQKVAGKNFIRVLPQKG